MRKKISFSESNIQQIKKLGLTANDVEKQMALYCRGSNFLKLNRSCTINDGIISFSKAERDKLIRLYEKEAEKFKIIKFVPASGAASRMFAEWFMALDAGEFNFQAFNKSFLRNLPKYPLYCLLAQNKRASKFIEQKDIKKIFDYVLKERGLNFGWLPKALIHFHKYSATGIRTALEEHLFEAAQYIRSAKDLCNLHFTVSREHKNDIAEKIKAVKPRYEKLCRVKYKISLSIQSGSTNTLAVDENDYPLRDDAGNLIFRPGGHGALLKNLQNLDADFIFVKNIDNVVPEIVLNKILPYKKMLGGLAIKVQEEVCAVLHMLEEEKIDARQIDQIKNYCIRRLNIIFPSHLEKQSLQNQVKIIFSLLDRPLRICAIVRNEGEPGGAPFWVEERDGSETLQIVESGHVNKNDQKQAAIWSTAKYFNPVDMVCCTKGYKGKKFNLDDYVDNDAYLITIKNEKGRLLKALELPGLWNGGMAYWNTVFVELPKIVFNPVKTVNDLLRPEHLIK
jgi:hypothetical protein